MARIAVAHGDLSAKGGAEGVCMTTVEALQDDHDVTLFTLFPFDRHELNRYFRTDVGPVDIRRPTLSPRILNRVDLPLYNMRNAALSRFVRRHRDAFDLVVSTDNELAVSAPAVQYVHTPRFGRNVVTERVGEDALTDHLYDVLSWKVGKYDAATMRETTLLANSAWMADVVQDAYGARPDVVNPPVDTRGIDTKPWDERENGFVTVGRIARYKNVHWAVEIVDGVRERGHDVHLHVVGPGYDDDYRREIEALADERPHVSVEGELPRTELVETLCAHRYGLHAKRHEHFGMAVAEMVAAGALPFVPANGGQREVVGDDDLLYHTPDDAVETIDRVLSDPDRERTARQDPGAVERRYGRERFKERMRAVVADALAA